MNDPPVVERGELVVAGGNDCKAEVLAHELRLPLRGGVRVEEDDSLLQITVDLVVDNLGLYCGDTGDDAQRWPPESPI